VIVRTQEEMLAAITSFVQADAGIRVALLNGSRAALDPAPEAAPDLLSDYDLLLGVRDVAAYATGQWLRAFGPVLLMQRPGAEERCDVWLVLFHDGVRIDFTFAPLEQMEARAQADSLTRVLADKDGRLPPLPPANESGYWLARPTAEEFAETVNEFWWVAVYVAKGLWREQLPYARHTFEAIVRPELERVLAWQAAHAAGWRWNPGAYNKRLQQALPAELWSAYEATMAGADVGEQWQALEAACALMLEVGPQLAGQLGYRWDGDEAQGACSLIAAIRAAPAHATTLGLPALPTQP
jgi:aminoglycoside 6-adenylyltransferase